MNRVGDVLGGALGLLVASPALALAALGIKLEDRGPILYRQRRVGLRGEEFELLKLRTMVVGAERRARATRSTAATRGSRASAASSGGSGWTSCRSSGTSSAAR